MKFAAAAGLLLLSTLPQDPPGDPIKQREARLVEYLLDRQKEDGTWRVGEKPNSRRAAQTLLICQALLEVREGAYQKRIDQAVERALGWLLAALEEDRKWRIIWDHILGLPVYRKARSLGLPKGREKDLDRAIGTCLKALQEGQGRAGTWSYTDLTGGIHTSFVTSSAVYCLMDAKTAGLKNADGMISRAVGALATLRQEDGAFRYYHPPRKVRADLLPGSIARNALCELVLLKAGRGSEARLRLAVDNFMKHYSELETIYFKFPGTHDGPYQIAPYYFFYGHYTTALSAVEGLKDEALKKKILAFIRSKLIDLDLTRYNKEEFNVGFEPFHATAYTIMTLRLVERKGR